MTMLKMFVLYFCLVTILVESDTIPAIVEVLKNINYEFIHVKAVNGKPTFLFIHGFPSSLHSWRHQTKYFSEQGYGCLVPNMMGYGKTYSPANENEFNSRSIVNHMLALLDRVGLSNAKVFVVGHDWGARTASRFVLYHPERTLGAVILSVAYSPPFKFDLTAALQQSLQANGYESIGYWEFFAASDAPGIMERNVDSFIDLLFASNSTLAKTDLAPVGKVRQWLTSGKRTNRSSYMTQQDYDTVHSYLVAGMQPKLNWFKALIANVDWEYEKSLNATVRRPVLFIEGSRDYIGIVGAAGRQKPYIPDLKLVALDTGHWVMEEAPAQVNREIDQWIKTVLANSSFASSSSSPLLLRPIFFLSFFIFFA